MDVRRSVTRNRFILPLLLLFLSGIAVHAVHAETLEILVYDRDLEVPLEGVLVREALSGASGVHHR
jgi:hypothetical protein